LISPPQNETSYLCLCPAPLRGMSCEQAPLPRPGSLVFAFVYPVIFLFSGYQGYRILYYQSKCQVTFALSQYVIVVCAALVRFVLAATVASGFPMASRTWIAFLISNEVAFSLEYVALTSFLYQWVIIYHFSLPSASRRIQRGVKIGFVVLIVGQFVQMVVTIEHLLVQQKEAGSPGKDIQDARLSSIINLTVILGFLSYGLLLSREFSDPATKTISRKLIIESVLISVALIAQLLFDAFSQSPSILVQEIASVGDYVADSVCLSTFCWMFLKSVNEIVRSSPKKKRAVPVPNTSFGQRRKFKSSTYASSVMTTTAHNNRDSIVQLVDEDDTDTDNKDTDNKDTNNIDTDNKDTNNIDTNDLVQISSKDSQMHIPTKESLGLE